MEDIDGGLHPAVDGQSLDEMRDLPLPYNIMTDLPRNTDRFLAYAVRHIEEISEATCRGHIDNQALFARHHQPGSQHRTHVVISAHSKRP